MAHVAIVDDSTSCLTVLRLGCEAAGHVVDTYADPVAALLKLICVPRHVLILNGHMLGMNGIEFFLIFRQFSSAPGFIRSDNVLRMEAWRGSEQQISIH